jgi:capsular exopolysaccharide synthesis family protein
MNDHPAGKIPTSSQNAAPLGGHRAPKIYNSLPDEPDRPSGGPGELVNLSDAFARLWMSRWLLCAGALLGVLLAVGASALIKPVYRAHTTVRLEQLSEKFPNLPDLLSTEPLTAAEVYLQNELRVIQSDSLARKVALQLGLDREPARGHSVLGMRVAGFVVPTISGRRDESADDRLISQVHNALSVRPSLKTPILEIAFDSDNPEFAAKAANTVVSEYVAMNREARTEAARNQTDWLTRQISDLKEKLDRGNADLQAFARSSGLLYGANQSLLSEEKARQVQEELSKAQADRAARQANYEAARSNSLEALPAAADSGLLREYESKLSTAQTELVQLRGLYTPAHYKVVEMEARVAQLEAAARTERERILARMRAELDAARRREDSLVGSYSADTRRLGEQTAAAFRYNVLRRDLESTELLYNSLLQKVKEAGVTSAMSAVHVRVIDTARPPFMPRSPNLPLNSSIGFVTGLLCAAGIVLVRNRDSYPEGKPVEWNELGIRGLGAIPYTRRLPSARSSAKLLDGTGKAGVELITWYEQPSEVTEAFRATITSIVFSPELSRRKNLVLTVTSIQPREGKTTTVSNLGIALAETHGRVLLVDADLRRPRIHEIFGHCNDIGLSTLLTGDGSIATMQLDNFLRKTSVPGLSTLPSGPGAASIPSLLYSQRMAALLERLRHDYDYVLIDSPPTSLFSDARVLGRQSDGLLLVVHAARVTRTELATTCRDLLQDGTSVVGTILNRCNSRARGYEGYRYPNA